MKRLREEGDRVESINMAEVLIFLSRGGEEARDSPGRVFECKTCNRQFPSFQALGGHRASHSKPRLVGDGQGQGQGQGQSALGKPRVHACSICGLEFPIGQALGGHMRRHRAATESFGHGLVEKKPDGKRALWLDLNLPPSEVLGDVESRKVGLSFEFVEKSPMVVDCFH